MKYYHSKTIVRRWKNKILTLRDDDCVWVEEESHLKSLVRDYYVNLFKE